MHSCAADRQSAIDKYAMMERPDDWFPLLVDNSTIFISTYITSFRNKHYKQKKVKIDSESGEITEE